MPKPKACDERGADPDDCIEACEYQPATEQLQAAPKWHWGLEPATSFPELRDVWSTPTVARIVDLNCDGTVDEQDPPTVVFVSGVTGGDCCSCAIADSCITGVLRVLDGSTGAEVWSSDGVLPDDLGFAGVSVALGDVDHDGFVDIVAMTGSGHPVVLDRNGNLVAAADEPVPVTFTRGPGFGWGGGLALGDLGGDGTVEVAYGRDVYTLSAPQLDKIWQGQAGAGGAPGGRLISYMVDVDGDDRLDLLAGNTAYRADGTTLWTNAEVADGYTAIGDLDLDGAPEVVVVRGSLWVLDGATGVTRIGPTAIPLEDRRGGPPTIADFDGDSQPEIGIAGGERYVAYRADLQANALTILWEHATQDGSSAQTGSSVFDFEGDGRAEVVYSDECFLRVLDGVTGELKFAAPNTTFTATEALIVADVDGDRHAEIVRVSNDANWGCELLSEPDPATGRPGWTPPPGQTAYRGITVFGDVQNAWVGSRTLWNQHAYSVSNICDGVDGSCPPGSSYGSIPTQQVANWSLDWLNNFRQNVQQVGRFDAPDALVGLFVDCTTPVTARVVVRNGGLAPLPAGVRVDLYVADGSTPIAQAVTTAVLAPGQVEVVTVQIPAAAGSTTDEYVARIVTDGETPYRECRESNNESAIVRAVCAAG